MYKNGQQQGRSCYLPGQGEGGAMLRTYKGLKQRNVLQAFVFTYG